MIRIYVEHANLTFEVENGFVLNIANGRRSTPDIECEFMDATFERLHVTRAPKTLHLDWLALTDLATWLYHEHPKMHWKRFTRKVLDYFPGSFHIKDAMRATMRCIAEKEHFAQGDGVHFIARVRSTHVDQMRMIKTTFAKQYGHLLITNSDAERKSL